MIFRRFTWLDFILLLILVAGIFFIFPALKSYTPGNVAVYLDNKIIAEYPLDTDRVFRVQGKEGPLDIEISGHSVSVRHASCAHQICVRTGAISRAFSQIVCVPNHILITLKAAGENGFDAIAK